VVAPPENGAEDVTLGIGAVIDVQPCACADLEEGRTAFVESAVDSSAGVRDVGAIVFRRGVGFSTSWEKSMSAP